MNSIEETSWHSYPSIYALGHRALSELLHDSVVVEEKLDGSQFSFGFFPGNENFPAGYRARSKGAQLHIAAPEKMFAKACEVVQSLPLREGWTYRAEYLAKPKHNTLAYERVPRNHLMIFDINPAHEEYLSPEMKREEADRIGLECVPCLYSGQLVDQQSFRDMLDTTSVLGGQKIEGVVIKNYYRFGPDKKVLMGKFVSEAFKEIHGAAWKASNPTSMDIIQELIMRYKTPARWHKSVQHLREAGALEQSPRDIGHLIAEAKADIERECSAEIAEALLKYALPKILRGCVAGLPEWYKEQLIATQFEQGAA